MNDAELVEKYGAMLLRAEAERDALRDRVAKLEAALLKIAGQPLDAELGDDGPWGSNYDFAEGHDQCIRIARVALKDESNE